MYRRLGASPSISFKILVEIEVVAANIENSSTASLMPVDGNQIVFIKSVLYYYMQCEVTRLMEKHENHCA